MDLMALMDRFRSDEKCRAYLEDLRWPNGFRCPRCEGRRISRVTTRQQFDCDSCRYQFSVTSGTIFHDSHLPLSKWLAAVYLMCESRKGISANQLKRTLAVSYKTAWYLCHRIRAAMAEMNPVKLRGTVEADETWAGGKQEGIGMGHYREKMTAVLGALQRGGKVRLQMAHRLDKSTLRRFLRQYDPEALRLITDENRAWRGVGGRKASHATVNHTAKEWVRGDIHTNGIENVWSLLNRSITGAYHKISKKHLPAYLDELAWRFNNRQNPWLFRDTVLKLLDAKALPYQKLVSS